MPLNKAPQSRQELLDAYNTMMGKFKQFINQACGMEDNPFIHSRLDVVDEMIRQTILDSPYTNTLPRHTPEVADNA